MKLKLREIATDLAVATSLLTRIPVVLSGDIDHGRAAWAWPVVGVGLGFAAGVLVWLVTTFGAGASIAAILGLAVLALMTGCIHEDGLADTADGFWGATEPRRKLEIMHDSRIGVYGTTALVLTLIARFVGINEALQGTGALSALVVSAALSRAVMLISMRYCTLARLDGLASACGKPSAYSVMVGGMLAMVVSVAMVGWLALPSAIAAAAAGWIVSHLATKKIGGHTGDTLGATQQTAEAACLLVLATMA